MSHQNKALPGGGQCSASNQIISLAGNFHHTAPTRFFQPTIAAGWIERKYRVTPSCARLIANVARIGCAA